MKKQQAIKKHLTRIQKRQAKIKEKIVESLAQHGNITSACKYVDITYDTFSRWRKEDETFAIEVKGSILAGKSSLNDLAQSHLITKIENDDIKAITFHLEHCHPDYNGKLNSPDHDCRPVAVINLIPIEIKYNPDRSLYENDIAKERQETESDTGEVQ